MDNPFYQNPQLDGKSFFLPGGDTGIILAHGFTATTVEVRALGEYLNRHGYTVSAPLLPGHGTRPEDLLSITWHDWVDVVEQTYTDLTRHCSRILAAGESVGGLLSLSLASRHPEIERVVLFSPALQIRKIWLTQFLTPFIKMVPKWYRGKDLDGHLPWQGYTVVVIPAANELRKFQRNIYRLLPHVKQPALIFQPRVDRTIRSTSTQVVYDRLGSSSKDLIWLEKSGHTVLLDIEREAVFQKTLDFITNGSQ